MAEKPAVADLEQRIKVEYAAACDALRLALRHAANAGRAVSQVYLQVTQGPWQEWAYGKANPIDRHKKMMCRRIGSLSDDDLNIKFATLVELMLNAAATHIGMSQQARVVTHSPEERRASGVSEQSGKPAQGRSNSVGNVR